MGYARLPRLGGRRKPLPEPPDTGWRNPSFRAYADHMGTEEFREDLGRLIGVYEEERACPMCPEAVWWRCHRRIVSKLK